uniref:Uncharacterized protein n=1 Tax=Gopherus evgoodei TaxID=1825980 RepID=A0A8C4YDT3_9SAUR
WGLLGVRQAGPHPGSPRTQLPGDTLGLCILGAALSLPACRRQPGPKQFLSEEKMAARFNTLSLENDHVYSGNGLPTRGPAPDPAWAQSPSAELVLWTPPGSQVPHSIRTLMLSPSPLAAPPLLPLGQGAQLEEMEL